MAMSYLHPFFAQKSAPGHVLRYQSATILNRVNLSAVHIYVVVVVVDIASAPLKTQFAKQLCLVGGAVG